MGYFENNTDPVIWHPMYHSSSQDAFIFTSTATGVGVTTQYDTGNQLLPLIEPNDQWVEFPIPDYCPDDTSHIRLIGIGEITNPSSHNLNYYLSWRRGNSTVNWSPLNQLQGTHNDGERDTIVAVVPVHDRKFDMKWSLAGANPQGAIDGGAVMGFNLKLVETARPFENVMDEYMQAKFS